jgi:hypothetical protein
MPSEAIWIWFRLRAQVLRSKIAAGEKAFAEYKRAFLAALLADVEAAGAGSGSGSAGSASAGAAGAVAVDESA